jgi:hypothetical protein
VAGSADGGGGVLVGSGVAVGVGSSVGSGVAVLVGAGDEVGVTLAVGATDAVAVGDGLVPMCAAVRGAGSVEQLDNSKSAAAQITT